MQRRDNHRLRSASAASAVAVTLLALGTAAAPAQNGRLLRSARPRLVATPAKLAPAQPVAPGDRIERLVELRVRGRGRLGAVYFDVAAPKSSALDADTTYGLQLAIDRCSTRWRTRGAAHSCPGKRTVVLRSRPLIGRARLKLRGLRARKPAHLRLVLTFPAEAGNALQAQATDATYQFVGVARG